MSRFKKRFAVLRKKGEAGFIPFVVLGDPTEETSLKIVKALIEAGADALELGFAFSDPIADGKTVQEADQRALESGTNPDKCLQLIKKIRAFDENIPISLLLYYNLIFQKGIDRFYFEAKASGVDAILAADCPIEEAKPLLLAAEKNGIDQVFIVSPASSNERLQEILKKCSGYVYIVSVLGVTGARSTLQERSLELIKRAKPFSKLPLCIGFGLSTPEHVRAVVEAGADGVIVGSAIINLVKKNLESEQKMLSSIKKVALDLKQATR